MTARDNTVRIVGMIGVTREPEATAGATLSVFGGGINPGAEVPAGVDGDYILEFARVHEESGFDMVLTGYSSSTPDGFEVAGYAAAYTTRLGYLIAHRPGFVAPTLAARKAATLDQLTGGRIALHIISGGSDAEQERDGDFLDHDARYRRTDEYMDILRRVWTAREPFDYAGEFYRLKGASSQVQCWQQPHLPLFFGGASDIALAVGSRRADVFALWGEPRASIKERIGDLRRRAGKWGRDIRFSLSVRPILGDTEKLAWQRAGEILDRVQEATRGKIGPGESARTPIGWFPPAAGLCRPGRPARRAVMDARRSGQWRGRQHYLSGRYCRAGGRLPAGLLRPGLHHLHYPGFRPAQRRPGIRPGANPPAAGCGVWAGQGLLIVGESPPSLDGRGLG